MSKNTNFLNQLAPRPLEQRAWHSTPRVKLESAETTIDLQNQINNWIDDLATPVLPDTNLNIVEIQYSSAQESNNTIRYSALIHYTIWHTE